MPDNPEVIDMRSLHSCCDGFGLSFGWASALVALTLGVVLFAVCRAWFVPAGRTFWEPFALTGALYLVIVSMQPLQELHYNLPTTQVVEYALEKLVPAPATYYVPSAPIYGTPVPGGATPVPPMTSGSGYGGTAPAYSATPYTWTYNEEMLLRMATTYSAADGFPAQARAFLWVAQCLWCLLLAFVMGVTCSWLFRSPNPSAG